MLSVCWLLTERQQVKLRACEVGGKCEYLSLGREYEARSSSCIQIWMTFPNTAIKLHIDGRRTLNEDWENAGIGYGDIVEVSFLDQTIDVPVVKEFGEAASRIMRCGY